MTKMTSIAALAATALSVALLTATPGQATPLGVTADARLAADNVGLMTNVVWGSWGHHRFHRSFFHRRAFFFHRRHFFARRAFAFHRFHGCRWC